MVAAPSVTPVTWPLLLTVAMAGLELVHVTAFFADRPGPDCGGQLHGIAGQGPGLCPVQLHAGDLICGGKDGTLFPAAGCTGLRWRP